MPGWISLVSIVELGWVLVAAYGLGRGQILAALEVLLTTKELKVERRVGLESTAHLARRQSRFRRLPDLKLRNICRLRTYPEVRSRRDEVRRNDPGRLNTCVLWVRRRLLSRDRRD